MRYGSRSSNSRQCERTRSSQSLKEDETERVIAVEGGGGSLQRKENFQDVAAAALQHERVAFSLLQMLSHTLSAP